MNNRPRVFSTGRLAQPHHAVVANRAYHANRRRVARGRFRSAINRTIAFRRLRRGQLRRSMRNAWRTRRVAHMTVNRRYGRDLGRHIMGFY